MNRTDWCAPIDAYCERTDAGFWSEPVNAVSNAAFLIAAFAAYRLWRRNGADDWPVLLLIGITTVVGIGSFLFHTFANRWSLMADVLPIMAFIYGFFLLAMRRFFGFGLPAALAITLGFLVFNVSFAKLWAGAFGSNAWDANGSVGYFPAALALIVVGAALTLLAMRRERNIAHDPVRIAGERAMAERVIAPEIAGRALLLAAAVFALSLVFRSIDLAVCSWLAVGTHFLWHTLNAVVLFTLLRGAIANRAMTLSARGP